MMSEPEPMAEPVVISSTAWPAVEISPRAAKKIAAGVLWVYSNEVERRDEPPTAAYLCRFMRNGRAVAAGYFNTHSLIAGRVLTVGDAPDLEGLLTRRLREAFARRAPGDGGAVRLVFSEADLLPGLVLDFYPPDAVLQSGTAGMDLLLPIIEGCVPPLIEETFGHKLQGLVLRCDAGVRRREAVDMFSRVSFGNRERLTQATVTEHGVRVIADLLGGQKTGFFLDQRDNRLFLGNRVRQMPGARVLDLFCYSGGWGLRALREGAGHVTFVDQSREAMHLLEKGLTANAFPPEAAESVRADVFEFLARDQTLYDVVVADPPAFVKSRKNLAQAIKAYQKLNRLAWRRVRPGGLLITCSCSHHLAEGEFLHLLAAALAREPGLAQIVHRSGQAEDHPALLSMPETAYLKCVGLLKMKPE
jgi:23S rRNA (cytosine1962-C5)-methyltransferase